jgi:hypothetical protein
VGETKLYFGPGSGLVLAVGPLHICLEMCTTTLGGTRSYSLACALVLRRFPLLPFPLPPSPSIYPQYKSRERRYSCGPRWLAMFYRPPFPTDGHGVAKPLTPIRCSTHFVPFRRDDRLSAHDLGTATIFLSQASRVRLQARELVGATCSVRVDSFAPMDHGSLVCG